jgi:hypothetical protein
MVLRRARTGKTAGQEFRGCSTLARTRFLSCEKFVTALTSPGHAEESTVPR